MNEPRTIESHPKQTKNFMDLMDNINNQVNNQNFISLDHIERHIRRDKSLAWNTTDRGKIRCGFMGLMYGLSRSDAETVVAALRLLFNTVIRADVTE